MTNKVAVLIVLLTNGAREELQALAPAVLMGKEWRKDKETQRQTVIGVTYGLSFGKLERLDRKSIITRH